MRQTKIDRGLIFLHRIFFGFLKSFTWKRIYGRFNGPKVFVNSIPKSGTNVVDNLFSNIPNLRFNNKRTIRKLPHNTNSVFTEVRKIKHGQYALAHLEYDLELSRYIEENNFKMILVVRDPRQVLVSHYKYVTEIDTNHITYKYFNSLLNDAERISAIINGVDGVVEPLSQVFKKYSLWKNNSNCLIVRFEDIIGSKGGGEDSSQHKTITSILNHLDIKVSYIEFEYICDNIYNSNSPTFRKGKLDGWKNELSTDHLKSIKNDLGDWLIEFGYEDDLNW